MGNTIQHSVKAIFKYQYSEITVALIKIYCDYYFPILILNFIWVKHLHASERTFPSLIYTEQEQHFKSILYYLLIVIQFHS